MRTLPTILFVISLLFSAVASHGTVTAHGPRELAGFILGGSLSECDDRLRMETVMPVRHLECIKEVEAKPIPGFKSGLLYFGDCIGTPRILRIKMKYADGSDKFFEVLMKRFKERFGEPDEWRGDPFHIVIAWKWYFENKRGDRITLEIQHNAKDMAAKMGNSVKLTYASLMDAEEACFREKQTHGKADGEAADASRTVPDWEMMVPK